MRVIFDMETDGLIENVTRAHCMCYYDIDTHQSRSIIDRQEMLQFITQSDLTIIGHNIIRYDIPVMEKLFGVDLSAIRQVDTLALSWYLYPKRKEHGLKVWGTELGVEKPYIDDWLNEDVQEYVNRCESDVRINTLLFNKEIAYLTEIYEHDTYKMKRIIDYLGFKMKCAREQEEIKWRVDIDTVLRNIATLEAEQTRKREAIASVMPPSFTYKIRSKPKIMYKKDGSISEHGKKWLSLLEEMGLPDYHHSPIQVIDKVGRGNPASTTQMKSWLFSLGWVPDEFNIVKILDENKQETGQNRTVPQVSSKENPGKLCQSVIDLIEENPQLKEFEGYFMINHRLSILRGFVDNKDQNNMLTAAVQGFANTLRFKHTVLVNLPTTPNPYWKLIRECLVAPDEDHVLCGSDMSSLEDNTKQHYMYYYDPNYVMEMRTPGFDPHIDISRRAKAMSYDEGEFYKWYDNKKEGRVYNYIPTTDDPTKHHILGEGYTFKELISLSEELQKRIIAELKPIRLRNKKVNFASVYGAGAAKLALTAKVSLPQAKELHTTYWQRNKAVKKVAEAAKHKTVDGQMWLYNPVSHFWYSLRYEKDKFSTLNQGTGVFCFDTWVDKVRRKGIKICGQFHDEIIAPVRKGDEEIVTQKLREAIDETNAILQLNVKLGISVDFGHSYADIH